MTIKTTCAFKNEWCEEEQCHMWVDDECVIKAFFTSLLPKKQGMPTMNPFHQMQTDLSIVAEENELEIP